MRHFPDLAGLTNDSKGVQGNFAHSESRMPSWCH